LNLISWIRSLSQVEQDNYFRQAARFFSNRELAEIIQYIRSGNSLYQAHLKSGVLQRYEVDLVNLKGSWRPQDSTMQ